MSSGIQGLKECNDMQVRSGAGRTVGLVIQELGFRQEVNTERLMGWKSFGIRTSLASGHVRTVMMATGTRRKKFMHQLMNFIMVRPLR